MKHVITRLYGGLGNQLFQYAAGRALAERLKAPLKIDVSEFEIYPLRHFELNKFSINAEVATQEETAHLVRKPSRFLRNACRAAIKIGLVCDKIPFKEKQFNYDELFERIRHPVCLDGYWQSEKYFKSVKNEIRSELLLANELGDNSKIILSDIQQSNSISLHIRRGDYVTSPSTAAVHGVCPLDYYFSAVRHITAIIENPKFFVFSDDLQWAKDNLKIGYPIRFVDGGGSNRDVEDMWLMKECQHHIIANSSFSWWAAWLNDKQDKIVIAPRIWFLNKKIDARDLIPDQWNKI
jgi:hypothetical protein